MNADLDALPAIPRDAEGPVFRAPWEAQAFGMAVMLHARGHFTWKEWAERLAGEIAAAQARRVRRRHALLLLLARRAREARRRQAPRPRGRIGDAQGRVGPRGARDAAPPAHRAAGPLDAPVLAQPHDPPVARLHPQVALPVGPGPF